MGILNVTPDSFSDGGKFASLEPALDHSRKMIDEGVDIIDIGGESTRPGASAVSEAEELDRVIPVVEGLRKISDIPISVDTSSPGVMTAAAQAGANLINDVRALRRDGALTAAASSGLAVCLMHMQGNPETMQIDPEYCDILEDIKLFFTQRIAACASVGIPEEKIILDPGFGFGKTPVQNLHLVNCLSEFKTLGKPLLVGLSRKSTISKILQGESTGARQELIAGSVAGALMAISNGASMVRVHDVAATVAALAVQEAIKTEVVTTTQ
jgi:dihydropteroate synthase